VAALRTHGCRDAGRVDLRCDAEGVPHVLEINPLPGLHPTHSDLPMTCAALGMPYQSLIARIIDSAWQRACSHAQAVKRAQPRRPHMVSQASSRQTPSKADR
jgi:D-alanine-D-alanine ligase